MLPNQRTSINLPRTLGARSTRAKLSQSGGLGAALSTDPHYDALPTDQTAWGYRARDIEQNATALSHKIWLRWAEEEARHPEHGHNQRSLFVLQWGQGLQNWAQGSRMRQLSAIEQKTFIRILSGLDRGLDMMANRSDKWYQLEQLAVSYFAPFAWSVFVLTCSP